MDTKTQNIVITVLGVLLVICLWFTFDIFGKKSDPVIEEQAIPYKETSQSVDLDFTSVDVDLDALREKYGNNLDSVYAAYFPEDDDVDYSKLEENRSSYAQVNENGRTVVLDQNPQYMVIAGAFSTNVNAQTFVKMLDTRGYQDAEIVKFDNSKYISVCVDRTDDLSLAREQVESLKALNIEAYVHTRKSSKSNN
ncbi:MAG: hypothetical protein KJP00_05450 [Bacteroidia bacterium]|nr:hypothetical protein [Bacteroidia bacterium]